MAALIFGSLLHCPHLGLYQVSPITDIDINADIVYNKLINLKTDKSPGPDGWPIFALRETALQIFTPLAIIF